jgi:hypothetical protein
VTIHVNRRIPVYEFVLRTNWPVERCEKVLTRRMESSLLVLTGVQQGSREFEWSSPLSATRGYLVGHGDDATDVVVTFNLLWYVWIGPIGAAMIALTSVIFSGAAARELGVAGLLCLVTVGGHFVGAGVARRLVAEMFG